MVLAVAASSSGGSECRIPVRERARRVVGPRALFKNGVEQKRVSSSPPQCKVVASCKSVRSSPPHDTDTYSPNTLTLTKPCLKAASGGSEDRGIKI